MQLHLSDLEKILDAMVAALRHNMARDEMNAAQHLANQVRYSPLTTILSTEIERLEQIIKDVRDSGPGQ